MFEGHDTTSSGISFTLYNLAKYPEIQQKVFEEVSEMYDGDKDRAVTLQDLSKLQYLDAVIKESQRLYPSVPYYGRELVEDVVSEGYTFPKSMNIFISPYLMGRDPKIFKDPLDFDPNRFYDNETTYEKNNPFGYVPFSAGPRNCVGELMVDQMLIG